MELLMIRHGQSEADLLHVHEGRADFSLTKTGEVQAARMSQYVTDNFIPDLIITSPLKRAHQTAIILREYTGCELLIENDLMEFNNGVLAGVTREEALRKYPIPDGGRPIHVPIEGGESELEFRMRAEKTLHKICNDYMEYDRIAIVSHGGMISNLLKSFLELPITTQAAFPTGDTGVHLVEITAEKKIVRFLNRQEHLRYE
ncbi:histidine phosphatase family protein [Jeotgalibacillus terrae]|uniref:Histidine phosphatase family protein n=1 Tax=Jeotgalibacillus terrae TaxID=587735 RepID=A0ABW5ZIF3_9BACL|nr:histidine phosphatase family protein [Jeotgalibacillus terrae]MBM7578682.1 2,3-bisphosphoglycerate-dependent phosphoglycerate mutase [Jeotgalibacillus terrae]